MDMDMKIRERVEEELGWEPTLDAAGIGVAARRGVITLSGEVGSWGEKHRAEKAASRVRGVHGVVNHIAVRTGPPRRTDEDLATAALTAVRLGLPTVGERVRVIVEKGVIELQGEVDWDFQRRAADRAVRDLLGVRGVVNVLRLRPSATPDDLKHRIRKAFERNAGVQADHVKVDVEGHRVALHGTVASAAEKREAERIVWAAPGVAEVENRIEIASEVIAF